MSTVKADLGCKLKPQVLYLEEISGIHSLPPEIIANMFEHLIPLQDIQPTSLYQCFDHTLIPRRYGILCNLVSVCSRWNHIAYSNNVLWSAIQISPYVRYTYVERLLDRSGSSPLHIHLVMVRRRLGTMKRTLEAVHKKSTQWETLVASLDAFDQDYTMHNTVPTYLPNLRTAWMLATHTRDPPTNLVSVPNLRSLGVSSRILAFKDYSGLLGFCVDLDFGMSTPVWGVLQQSARSLQSLTLMGDPPSTLNSNLIATPLFPLLISLTLSGLGGATAFLLLISIHAPMVATLHLEDIGRNTYARTPLSQPSDLLSIQRFPNLVRLRVRSSNLLVISILSTTLDVAEGVRRSPVLSMEVDDDTWCGKTTDWDGLRCVRGNCDVLQAMVMEHFNVQPINDQGVIMQVSWSAQKFLARMTNE